MRSSFWDNKRVLVTGGTGFIGSFIAEQLAGCGARVTVPTRESGPHHHLHPFTDQIILMNGDLEDPDFAEKVMDGQEVVFHLASLKRNITFHQQHPADLLSVNTRINLNVLAAASRAKIQRLTYVSTIIADQTILSDTTSAHYGYAWSKFFGEVAVQAYAHQYQMPVTIIRPENIYGPRDNFDPKEGQVVPALMRRVLDGENPLLIQGDGSQRRSFAYVEEAAAAIIYLTQQGVDPRPIILKGPQSITVADLARMILVLSGRNPEHIQFNRRHDDSSVAQIKDNSVQATRLEKLQCAPAKGLVKTMEWYLNQRIRGAEH